MEYQNKSQKSKVKSQKYIKLFSPAKINIGLLVKEKLPSGYHNIETIMVPIKLFDTIIIKRIEEGISFKIDSTNLPSGKENLVVKAARLFFDATKLEKGVEIILKKRIPIGAGLGGGSSDAASTLLGLNQIFGKPLNIKKLLELAVKIGMDVPFFIYGKPCYATGRGEKLQPINLPQLNIILYVPAYGVSTKWAYQELVRSVKCEVKNALGTRHSALLSMHSALTTAFDVGLTDSNFSLKILMKRLINNDLVGISALICNSFESIVFSKHPDLLEIRSLFLANGAFAASLSGSGSAIFAIIEKSIASKMKHKFGSKVFITETLS